MTTYIFKSSISLIIMFGLYWFLLRNEKLFVFNRFFLILSVLLSLVLPLISIPVNFRLTPQLSEIVPVINYNKPPTVIEDTYIQSDSSIRQPFIEDKSAVISISAILLVFYISGVILFLTNFLRNVYLLIRRSRLSEKISLKGYQIVLTNEKIGPYCFFRNIYLNKDDYLNNKIDKALLNHELEHVRQLHSGDIVLIELVKIFYWFNPVHILYGRAIRMNHEYLADNGVINDYSDMISYADIMLSFIAGRGNVPLTSGSNNFTKRRLIMMLKSGSRRVIYRVRIALTLCIGATFFLLLSCKESNLPLKAIQSGTGTGVKNGKAIGFVFNQELMPLKDAIIVFGDSSLFEISVDSDGRFAIDNIREDKSLIIGCSGYETQIIKPDLNAKMIITLIKIGEKDTRPVRGYVVNKSGENLNGVQVALKNKNTKAITGHSGRFTIFGVKQGDSLVLSYKGYRIQTLKPLFYSDMYVKLNIGPEFMSPMKEVRDTSPSSKPGSIFLVGGRIHYFGNNQRNLKSSTENGVSKELFEEYQRKYFGGQSASK